MKAPPSCHILKNAEVGESDVGEIVAIGTWLYDRQVPRSISIRKIPAEWAASRYDWELSQWNEESAVPETPDGFLYYCFPGNSGEHLSIDGAKAWADAQPWGPVNWSDGVPIR